MFQTKPARYIRAPHLDLQQPRNTRDAWAWEDLSRQAGDDGWSAHVYVYTHPHEDPNQVKAKSK